MMRVDLHVNGETMSLELLPPETEGGPRRARLTIKNDEEAEAKDMLPEDVEALAHALDTLMSCVQGAVAKLPDDEGDGG